MAIVMIFSLGAWRLADGLHDRLHDGGGVANAQLDDVSRLQSEANQMDEGKHD